MMLLRSSAAVCGALFTLAVSVAAARSETAVVHSTAVVDAASGERYDPSVGAAAIKTTLREKFGGVLFGARPKFALVEAVGKKIIVKINDVGPLTPGRIIDLNERAMRYFDPSMERGVINHVKVSPLAGDFWVPGPVG
jgi:rare lipoprotein A